MNKISIITVVKNGMPFIEDSINSFLEAKYGKDFFNTLRKDFGLKNFDDFKKRIYNDFKDFMSNKIIDKHFIAINIYIHNFINNIPQNVIWV